MRIYQGDTYTFTCSLPAAGTVTTAPLVTIFRASTQTPVITSQAMSLVAGSAGLYLYPWLVPQPTLEDDYIAIVSYATTSATVSGQYLEKIHVGDVRITSKVALDATSAKDATVAKDSTVAHALDVTAINPSANATVLAILAKVNLLPADPASNGSVLALKPLIQDIRDYALGTWTIDKTQTPNVMSLFGTAGALLATFRVFENETTAYRTA